MLGPEINYSYIDQSKLKDKNEREKLAHSYAEYANRYYDIIDTIMECDVPGDVERYMRGFMFELEFIKSKRFNRFVNKIQEMGISWCERYFPFCKNLKDVICFSVVEEILNVAIFQSGKEVSDEYKIFSIHMPHLLSDNPSNPCILSPAMVDVYKMAATSGVLDNVIQYEIVPVTAQWIYRKCVLNRSITIDNFMLLAIPQNDDELMLYIGDLIRAVHSALSSLSLSVIKGKMTKKMNIHRHKERAEKLQAELDKSNEQIEVLSEELRKERKKNEDCEKKLQSLDQSAITKIKDDHAEEKQELLTSLRKANERHDDLLGKYNDLKSRYKILEAEIEYSGEDEEGLDDTKLTRESRFLFVCDPAPSSSFQRTYDTILSAFPNSKMVHETPTTANNYDAIVLLVKYMFHHSSYYSTRDWCKAHKIPCLHCDKQGVDLVIDDVINRRRYSQTGG